MKILVILAHPDTASFNYALAETAIKALTTNGHEVIFHDLYREKFPPVIPAREIPRNAVLPKIISRHCADITQADGIIIVHPNWWGQPPAILKGWIDRVLRPGVAYTFAEGDKGDGKLIGLLKAERSWYLPRRIRLRREKPIYTATLSKPYGRIICSYPAGLNISTVKTSASLLPAR